MHYPTTAPGPEMGKLSNTLESMNAPLRGGTVKAFYREEMRDNCCGDWPVPVIQWCQWTMGGDVFDLTDVEKFELEEYIGDRM